MDTDFYFETPHYLYFESNNYKVSIERISIKGGVLSELNISRFSSSFSNISALVYAPYSFFHCKGQSNPEFYLYKEIENCKITIKVFKKWSKL